MPITNEIMISYGTAINAIENLLNSGVLRVDQLSAGARFLQVPKHTPEDNLALDLLLDILNLSKDSKPSASEDLFADAIARLVPGAK